MNYQPRQCNATYNRAFMVDWSLIGIMTLKFVIRESNSTRPAGQSILISQITSSSAIIPYIIMQGCHDQFLNNIHYNRFPIASKFQTRHSCYYHLKDKTITSLLFVSHLSLFQYLKRYRRCPIRDSDERFLYSVILTI